MYLEYINPQIKLIAEKTIKVMIGEIFIRSAQKPTKTAISPMNNTYIMYFMVVAFALKVHFALAKKEKVTATQNAAKFESDCSSPLSTHMAKVIQCMSVFMTPTDTYRAKSLSIEIFCKEFGPDLGI
jgi:hypothetical protein